MDFIIARAKAQPAGTPLVLLPIGKLTNIALALAKDPSIAKKVRIVWLGSNYPAPGEYNQDNDPEALRYVLSTDVPFEMVLGAVRHAVGHRRDSRDARGREGQVRGPWPARRRRR